MPIDLTTKQKNTELLGLLRKDLGIPLNEWAVAAWLETTGIRDIDVREEYDQSSVFELANDLFGQISRGPVQTVSQEVDKIDRTSSTGKKIDSPGVMVTFIRKYFKGLAYSFPLFFQLISLVLFGYALWVWLLFNEAQATMISLATIGSFILTGGFSQVISREISRYRNQEDPVALAKITISILKAGGGVLGAAILAVCLLNLLIPFYPMTFILLGSIYVLLIGLLSLLSAALFAMDRHLVVLLGYIVGTAIVVGLMRFTVIGIYSANWLGMAAANGFLWLYLKRILGNNIKSVPNWMHSLKIPGREVLLWQNYQYFLYGSAYFVFLFIDRTLAWSAFPHLSGYAIWFRTPYELGMDWAILPLVLTIGILEFSVYSFSVNIQPLQKKHPTTDIAGFRIKLERWYRRELVLTVLTGLLMIFLVYCGGMFVWHYWGKYRIIDDFFSNPITNRVFWVASVSYLFFVVALLHILHFFLLNRPGKALKPLAISLLINFGVGFMASRWLTYDFADLGLLAGSVFLAAYTGLLFRQYIKRIDFYYYSAY